MKKHKRGYWTYKRVLKEAKKYNTRSEFRNKSKLAYQVAIRREWLEKFTWLEEYKVPRKWTFENVKEAALKYKTKVEFSKGSPNEYAAAYKYKWISKFDWLEDSRLDIFNGNIDSVYAYEFKEFNAVYIGRTLIRSQKQRDWQHIFCEKDTVRLFAKEKDVQIPEMKILEDNLTLKDGVKKEGYWVEEYRKNGWTILNRAKTGSIGGLGKGKWNYEKTKKEAKKYKTRKDFQVGSSSAYHAARKNKWLDDYTWFIKPKPKKKWTKEATESIARIYRTKNEFRQANGGAYSAAIENGWLKDYDWFISGHQLRIERDRKWTHEKTKLEAAKYPSRSTFKTNSGSAYSAALKNGWLDEFFPKIK